MQNIDSLQTELLYYAFYFGGSVVMLVLFAIIYMAITPYDEIALIRKGSGAAALSFGGTIIGFSLPLAASAIYNTGFCPLSSGVWWRCWYKLPVILSW